MNDKLLVQLYGEAIPQNKSRFEDLLSQIEEVINTHGGETEATFVHFSETNLKTTADGHLEYIAEELTVNEVKQRINELIRQSNRGVDSSHDGLPERSGN